MNYLNQLKEWNACSDGLQWAVENNITTVEKLWEKCERADWLMWCVEKSNKISEKRLIYISALFAETVLHIYEKQYPNDSRVRDYIQARKDYFNDKITLEELEKYKQDAARARAVACAACAVAARAAAADADADAVYAAAANAAYAVYAADAARAARTDDAARKNQHVKMIEIIKQNIDVNELIGGETI